MDSLFFPHTIFQSRFFLICRPWKFAALGPGPCGPCVNTAMHTHIHTYTVGLFIYSYNIEIRNNSNYINYKHFVNMKGTIYVNRLSRVTQVEKKKLGTTILVQKYRSRVPPCCTAQSAAKFVNYLHITKKLHNNLGSKVHHYFYFSTCGPLTSPQITGVWPLAIKRLDAHVLFETYFDAASI